MQALGIIIVVTHCHQKAVGHTFDLGAKCRPQALSIFSPDLFTFLERQVTNVHRRAKRQGRLRGFQGLAVSRHSFLHSEPGVSKTQRRGETPLSSPSSLILCCTTPVPVSLGVGWSRTCARVPTQGGPSFGRFAARVTGQEKEKSGLEHCSPLPVGKRQRTRGA